MLPLAAPARPQYPLYLWHNYLAKTILQRGATCVNQPCRCLWRGLLHTTKTTPPRRTILQFSQIRLTLARIFMAETTLSISNGTKCCSIAASCPTTQGPRGGPGKFPARRGGSIDRRDMMTLGERGLFIPQIGTKPPLNLGNLHSFAAGIVLHLVSGDPVDGKIAGFRMREVESANGCGGIHCQRFGQSDACMTLGGQEVE